MQVFRVYYKILKKHMVPILIYAVLFLLLTMLITSQIKVENTQFKTNKIDIMVINQDGESEFLNGFLNYLNQYAVLVEPKENEEARKDALFYREVEYILTIPAGFTKSFLSGEAITLIKEAVPDSVEAISVDNAINNYLNLAKEYISYIPDIKAADIEAYVSSNLEQEAKVTISVQTKDEVTYSNVFNQYYFNYLGYILVATLITGVSVVMFSFQNLDLRRRNASAPVSSKNMNLQLLLANLIFVTAYLIILCLAGYILNKDRMININMIMMWINAFVFTLTALSISFLVGILVRNRKAVNNIATALSLSMAFLSGIFVPQDIMAAPVLKVASATPVYWFVRANNAIAQISSLKGQEVSSIIGYMAIQIGFAAAIISISLVVSKRKRQQAA